jgi:ribonuclease HII
LKNNLITAGVDEVGRGCLAGPVVSAAVILNKNIDLKLIKDSKKINFKNRLIIAEYIKKNSYSAIGVSSVKEIFELNILKASLLSMKRAVNKLPKKPGLIQIDGPFAPEGLKNYQTIIKGDEKIKCIGAASILAKVYRDLLMIKLSKDFNNYAWERNFGYGTKAHLDGLSKFGITIHHRKGFKPVHNILINKSLRTQENTF